MKLAVSRPCRSRLERLESRQLLADFTFSGTADSNGDGLPDGDGVSWNDALNWTKHNSTPSYGVPGEGDDVDLSYHSVVAGNVIVNSVNGGILTAGSLTADRALTSVKMPGGGSIHVASSFHGSVESNGSVSVTADDLSISHAIVAGSLTLTADQTLQVRRTPFSNREITVQGALTVTSPSIMLQGPITSATSIRLNGSMNGQHDEHATFLTPRFEIPSTSVIDPAVGSPFSFSGDVDNRGYVRFPNAISNAGTFYNRAGATLIGGADNVINDGTWANPAGGHAVNRGLVTVTDAATANTRFTQQREGTLHLQGIYSRVGSWQLTNDIAEPITLAGKLKVELLDDQDPAVGTKWAVAESRRDWMGTRVGTFDRYLPGGTPSGHNLRLSYTTWGAEVTVVDAAPTIAAGYFDDEIIGNASAIILQLDEPTATITQADVELINRTTGLPISGGWTLAHADESQTVRVTLPTTLADGDYELRIRAGSAVDRIGNANAADLVHRFHILAGDINRDRVVNFSDLLILAQNYGQTGRTYSQGNVDYSADGAVGFGDLLLLAQRYGQTLLSAAQSSSAASQKNRRDRPADAVLSPA